MVNDSSVKVAYRIGNMGMEKNKYGIRFHLLLMYHVIPRMRNANFINIRPRWGAYDAPPDPLVGWEGIGAYSASILVPSALASVLPYHLYVRGAASVCVYCVNCTKFGQLILKIIIKFDATRCQIFRLKCTKIVSAGAPPQTPLGSLQRSPRPPSWIKGAYF